MSLVGSLEDLALGDILRIVSLARKSGHLILRCELGDGRIVFSDGLVQAAFAKGEPEDLAGLITASNKVDPDVLRQAIAAANESDRPREELLSEGTGLSSEVIDSLRREHVARVVIRMFGWNVGEFGFEVRDEIDERDRELALSTGIDVHLLSMEAARIGDEQRAATASGAASADDPVLSGAAADDEEGGPEVALEPEEPGSAEPAAADAAAVSLIVIDRDLRALEWIKSLVADHFARVHIFQKSEDGIARIRQYLTRGELPTVLVTIEANPDSLRDSSDPTELLRRLRSQAPRMPILVMHDGDEPDGPGVAAADALIARPASSILNDRRRQDEVEAAGTSLLDAVEPWSRRDEAPAGPDRRVGQMDRRAAGKDADPASLERMREISDRLRDPCTVAEVLTLAMEFAAESFARVAIFRVREDEAVGITQRGLAAAGGPNEAGFRQLRVPLVEPACFQEVIASRRPQRFTPDDDGDRQLSGRLGDAHPAEIFVAPIESGGQVAAILYADNLPGGARMGEPVALSVVLHEAGMALDRALADSEGVDPEA